MRQTLFYLPTQIAGYPLFGTGILFWIILLVGIFTVARNLIFRKSPGDAIFYASLTALGLLLVRFVGPSISEVNGFPRSRRRSFALEGEKALEFSARQAVYGIVRRRSLWHYRRAMFLRRPILA